MRRGVLRSDGGDDVGIAIYPHLALSICTVFASSSEVSTPLRAHLLDLLSSRIGHEAPSCCMGRLRRRMWVLRGRSVLAREEPVSALRRRPRVGREGQCGQRQPLIKNKAPGPSSPFSPSFSSPDSHTASSTFQRYPLNHQILHNGNVGTPSRTRQYFLCLCLPRYRTFRASALALHPAPARQTSDESLA